MLAVFYGIHLPDRWLVSAAARRFYSIAALVSLFLWLGVLFGTIAAAQVSETPLREFPVLRMLLLMVMFPGVIATSIVWVAMSVLLGKISSSELGR